MSALSKDKKEAFTKAPLDVISGMFETVGIYAQRMRDGEIE